MRVEFHETADDGKLKFAVIGARANGKWVFCKHKMRDTWEMPGGHREPGESIDEAAERELKEETGAVKFDLRPVCFYSVDNRDEPGGAVSFGGLYFADIYEFGKIDSEIERIALMDTLPENLTYPQIQPELMKELEKKHFSL